jgi:hypothetical protein
LIFVVVAADMMSNLTKYAAPDASATRLDRRDCNAGDEHMGLAIKFIHVMAIEPSAMGTTASCYQYKVKLEANVSTDPEAALPSYGWEDNPNYRWIRLCPDGRGGWAISSFGTGP